MLSAVSSSSRLAVADEGSASLRTWFAKGRPDSANGLSVIVPPSVELFILLRCVRVKGRGRSWLGASITHESTTMRIPTVFVNSGGPGKTLDGRAIPSLRGKELQVLVRLTRTAKVATFQKRGKIRHRASGSMLGLKGADTMGTAAWLRTIIKREQMLSCVARCTQQNIRLDEVAWLQRRCLALEF